MDATTTRTKRAVTGANSNGTGGAGVAPRTEYAAVRRYLESLDAGARREDPAVVRAQLDEVRGWLEDATGLRKVALVQKRLDLEERLAAAEAVDVGDAEEQFVQLAAPFARRKGISWEAWRTVGVPAAVLRRAGLSRASSS